MMTRISRSNGWFMAVTLAFITLTPAFSAPLPTEGDTTWTRPLPFGADWALARGIDLPNPFGVGTFLVVMSRDFEVNDVRVTLPGQEPASISDVASFDVRNHTTLAALKLDAWILPLLNVYVLAGHTWTDSKLNAAITIKRPIRDPVVMNSRRKRRSEDRCSAPARRSWQDTAAGSSWPTRTTTTRTSRSWGVSSHGSSPGAQAGPAP